MTPCSMAACRSTWSEPMPAVIASFRFASLGDPLGGQVRRPERLGDDDVGVDELALEHRVGAVLVRGHDQRVTLALEVVPQAELAGDAAEQFVPA